MRPIPLLVRTGLFAVGFGVGLSHHEATPPQKPAIIELRIVMPDSSEELAPLAPIYETDFTNRGISGTDTELKYKFGV